MKIGIIVGSHRKNSQSSRVGAYIEKQLKPASSTFIVDIGKTPLPLWDEEVWSGGEKWKKNWTPIAEELQKCDGFVVISPEWAGMVPAGLKNFFLLASSREVGHKPALIVSVSASRGGAYPVQELRISSYKNNYLCYLPTHVIVRDVEKMLAGDAPANDDDKYLRGRMKNSLDLLIEYAKALKLVRESGVIDDKTYPYGM